MNKRPATRRHCYDAIERKTFRNSLCHLLQTEFPGVFGPAVTRLFSQSIDQTAAANHVVDNDETAGNRKFHGPREIGCIVWLVGIDENQIERPVSFRLQPWQRFQCRTQPYIDHRIEPHYPGVRDLTTSPSTRKAAEVAGLGNGPIEVAELSAQFSHQEGILLRALGLGNGTEINPSGGALAANPIMATGLVRIAEAAKQIRENGRHRVLAHATSGPLLQQNLVAILEGNAQ